MKRWEFVCPECGNNAFHMTEAHIYARNLVYDVYEDGMDIYDTDYDHESAEVEGYFCEQCGFEIPVNDEGELVEWIMKHGREQ